MNKQNNSKKEQQHKQVLDKWYEELSDLDAQALAGGYSGEDTSLSERNVPDTTM